MSRVLECRLPNPHSTGDLGLDLILDILEKLQWERPRLNHGFTIEHLVFDPRVVSKIAALGHLYPRMSTIYMN